MKNEELQKLLNELADVTAEPIRGGLADEIKSQVPQPLTPHKGGMDAVNIVIHLRISKFAAAAIIIVTMLLCAHLLGDRSSRSNGILQESRFLISYLLGGENPDVEVQAGLSGYYENLLRQGIDVAYYGDNIDPEDANAVLMHWKISEGWYKVIFADLHIKTVSPEELIELQRRMLQKKVR
jgi:hypothetical protein